jgi:hypothetical protein
LIIGTYIERTKKREGVAENPYARNFEGSF